jgi:hypothetical protein
MKYYIVLFFPARLSYHCVKIIAMLSNTGAGGNSDPSSGGVAGAFGDSECTAEAEGSLGFATHSPKARGEGEEGGGRRGGSAKANNGAQRIAIPSISSFHSPLQP